MIFSTQYFLGAWFTDTVDLMQCLDLYARMNKFKRNQQKTHTKMQTESAKKPNNLHIERQSCRQGKRNLTEGQRGKLLRYKWLIWEYSEMMNLYWSGYIAIKDMLLSDLKVDHRWCFLIVSFLTTYSKDSNIVWENEKLQNEFLA